MAGWRIDYWLFIEEINLIQVRRGRLQPALKGRLKAAHTHWYS